MAVVSRQKRGRYVFLLGSAVSCSWDMLRKKRVNKKCQHLSILIESQLAGWPAGDCSQFSASSWDSLCICFQRGVLNKTSAVWCEHPGGSALFLGNAPREWKCHREGDLALRNGNARPAVQRHAGGCSNWSRVSI